MRIGYARVSNRDQHPEAHHDALTAASCEQGFIEMASGKLARRPELDQALVARHICSHHPYIGSGAPWAS